jgi:hypothetical protein
MATNKELEQELAELKALLAAHGIGERPLPAGAIPPEERSDYIKHGSPEHLVYLGLERVDNIEAAREANYIVYTSPKKKSYRLLDELGASRLMLPLEPSKGILMILREKVSSFESGPPKPFAGAPARFIPPGDPEFTRIA